MEKIFQEHARYGGDTHFYLVRYGNVLESRGSVIESWKRSAERGEAMKVTDTSMTRFWLSPTQAAKYCEEAFHLDPGLIYIPKMPALSIGKLLEYIMGDYRTMTVPMRPGEKLHETLLTVEETEFATDHGDCFVLCPTTEERYESDDPPMEYSSEFAPELTREQLSRLLEE